MKRFFLSFCLSLAVMLAWAKPVNYETAVKAAETFAASQMISIADNPIVSVAPEGMFRQLYVFGFDGTKGFVVIAADDRVIPILGYSTTTYFETSDMPKHVQEWFMDYDDQIDSLIAHRVEQTAEIRQQWNALLTPESNLMIQTATVVGPLVSTTWNQSPYYNNLCPSISGEKTVTGCTATAMAQVMKYWEFPTSGQGSHSYYWNGRTLSADFQNITYDWNNMPTSLNAYSTATQVNAVATLMYHVGVAIEMDYGVSSTGGSGAAQHTNSFLEPSAQTALQTIFKYSNGIRNVNYGDVTDAEWKSILKNELDAGRVMMYEGRDPSGGHSFVCDGYDTQNYFHFNWGWGGSYDGFYAIGDLHPGTGGTGGNSTYTFNIRNAILVGIEPNWNTTPTNTVVTATVSNPALGSVSGSGTYNANDTAVLFVSANEGYMFEHWDDNDLSNPRYVFATTPTVNRTAYISALPTDTLHYCGGSYESSYGSSSGSYTREWGIRYPASALNAGKSLASVQLMLYVSGYYTIKLYQGDDSQMSLVYSQQFYSSTTLEWIDVALNTPYQIDNSKSLWIALENTGSGYPLVFSAFYPGNGDGFMYKNGSDWTPFSDLVDVYGSWLIKGVTQDGSNPPIPTDTIEVVCEQARATFYAEDNDLYIVLQNADYGFAFDVVLPNGSQDIIDGVTYTLANMLSDYTYGVDNVAQTYIIFSSASLTRSPDGSYEAYVTDENGIHYHITYSILLPITQPTDTVFVSMSNVNYQNKVYDFIADMGVIQLIGYSDSNDYLINVAFNTDNFSGNYTLADRYEDDNYFMLYHIIDGENIQIPCNNLLGAIVSGTADSCYATIKWVSDEGILYWISFTYHVPTPQNYVTLTSNNLTITQNSNYEQYQLFYGLYVYDFQASDSNAILYGTVYNNMSDNAFGTWTLESGDIEFNLYDANTLNQISEPFSGTIAITDNDTVFNLTGSSLLFNNTEYTFNVKSTPLATYMVTANAYPPEGGFVIPDSTIVVEGSEVTLTAQAAMNHKFIRWSDGETLYSRNVTVSSDTVITAIFEALRSDTTTYCANDGYVSNLGFSTSEERYFAVKFNQGIYSLGDSIHTVLYFDIATTVANIYFFTGDDAPETFIYSQPIVFTGSGMWNSVLLDSPVPCPVDQPLWFVISAPGDSYFGAYTDYSANPDAFYYSGDGENWYTAIDAGFAATFMVKIVTAKPTDTVNYSVIANAIPETYGYVIPDSVTVPAGSQVQVVANANSAYRFSQWNDGNTNYSRVLPVNENISLNAEFESIAYGDTLTYSIGEYMGNIGNSGLITWGIKLAPEAISADKQLYAFSYYLYEYLGLDFTARIYLGGEKAPGRLVSQFQLPEMVNAGWNTFQLPSPLECGDSAIWIILSTTAPDQYPATYSRYTANPNGSYCSTDGGATYYNIVDYGFDATWMIKALMADIPVSYIVVSQTADICQGSSFLWRGRDINASGVYCDTVISGTRSDTVFELDLTVHPSFLNEEIETVCNGMSYFWRGKIFSESGIYYDSLLTRFGCDSVFKLTLTVSPAYFYEDSMTICQGDTYFWHGRTFTEAGVYYDSLLTAAGCDFVFQLTLTVNPSFVVADEVSVFDIDLPYRWRGRNLTESGIYFDTLQTVLGCDSVVRLTLTVNPYICVAPTNLVAERTGIKSFQFSWENPTIGTEDEQANYFTYLFSETAVDPDTVAPTKTCRTVTTIAATGSLYNNEYHFYVKNVSNGVSSEWAETTISSLSQYPEVGNLTVENVETKAVTLSWTRHQYGTERKWKVDVTLKSDGSAVKSVVANNDTFRITGLEALTEYTFTVSPRINSATFGDPMSIDATTLAMPAAPINLVAELIDTRYVRFSWENGAEITPDSYDYKVSTKFIDMSKDKYNDNPNSTIEGTTVDLGPLTYATKYYLYVRCNVGDAASDWSMVDIKTGQKNPPVTNLHAEDETPTSLTAVWTKNQFGTEPRWIVVLRRASDDFLIDSVNKNVQNHTFTGLERGTEYILSVYPRYNGGATGLGTVATTVVRTAQTCEAPTNLTVDSDTYRYLTFNWDNPTLGTEYEEPNNFTIIFRPSSGPIDPDEVTPKATGLTEATYSSEKLTKGATYYFYVRNEYDGAVSAWTGPIVFTVPATAPTTIDGSDDDEFIAGEVIPAEAFVNMGVLHVENLVENVNVMLIDAAGRTIYNGKADNTHMEFDLTVRGIYMVVLRGEQNQVLKVVY